MGAEDVKVCPNRGWDIGSLSQRARKSANATSLARKAMQSIFFPLVTLSQYPNP